MFLYSVVFQLVALKRGKSHECANTVELVTGNEFLEFLGFLWLQSGLKFASISTPHVLLPTVSRSYWKNLKQGLCNQFPLLLVCTNDQHGILGMLRLNRMTGRINWGKPWLALDFEQFWHIQAREGECWTWGTSWSFYLSLYIAGRGRKLLLLFVNV